MAVRGRGGLGIPTALLHESEGFIITVETKQGDWFRGLLWLTEDNFNLHLKNVTFTDGLTGNSRRMDEVFIRGNQIFFIVLPETLSHAPIFDRIEKFVQTKGKYVPAGGGAERKLMQYGGAR